MGTVLNKNDILDKIVSSINLNYVGNAKFYLKENKSSYDSILVKSEMTAYRCFDTSEMLFARLKTNGKIHFISFPERYDSDFEKAKIPYKQTKTDRFLRVDLNVFNSDYDKQEELNSIFNKIFINLFSFESFGCCHKYVECSDAKKCLHVDSAYATACMYRKSLENGRIFYGKNKNI